MRAGRRPVAVVGLLILGFLALVAYWVDFYAWGDVQVRGDKAYLTFQKAFALADAWLAVCSLAAAVGLLLRREWGFLFGLLAASSAIFLGLMDVCFNLNEGIYLLRGAAVWIEVAINVTCLSFGVFIIAVLWLRRADLLSRGKEAAAADRAEPASRQPIRTRLPEPGSPAEP
ncbi:MAG: hypothetical protein AMK72_12135 [Planctomycetes bacterium SM23_25]|jgi:hypothetical protein|nr:MAG: hypothetical protein AMK72_12135 [Planctomycetes bacterium SM23_25]